MTLFRVKQYEVKEHLGEGTYGKVYKAWDNTNSRWTALKQMKHEREDEGIPITSIREIAVLLELKHENIVDLYELFIHEKTLYLVFEYCDQDLYKFTQNYNGKISMKMIRQMIEQMLRGLSFCHKHHILHRDIKPQNILINNNLDIKLGDFGLARLTTNNVRKLTHEVVTLWYRAPEILLGCENYTGAIDVWSTAVIFGELLNREELFKGRCKYDQLIKIFLVLGTPTEQTWEGVSKLKYYLPNFPKFQPKVFNEVFAVNGNDYALDLLKKMLIYKPEDRITCDEALKHPFFTSVKTKENQQQPQPPQQQQPSQ